MPKYNSTIISAAFAEAGQSAWATPEAMGKMVMPGALPDPDPVLKKLGKDISTYREMLADARVGSAVEQRKGAVKALEWKIERGQAKAAVVKEVQALLESLPLHQIIGEVLDAPFFGFSVLEIMWGRGERLTTPLEVVGKPAEWFFFDEKNQLRLRSQSDQKGLEPPPNKVVLARHNATYANPYGERVLSRVFWPWTFKRGGARFWATFIEKYAQPFLVGKLPRGTAKDEQVLLLEALESMVQDAVAVIPDDGSIEFLTDAQKGNAGTLYQNYKSAWDLDIAIAICGQNLSTEVQGGSLAAAKAHLAVRADIRDADVKIVEAAVGRLIDCFCELNWGPGPRPEFSLFAEEEIGSDLAVRDEKLAGIGVEFTPEYFQDVYKLDPKHFTLRPKSPEAPGQTPPDKTAPGAGQADKAQAQARADGQGPQDTPEFAEAPPFPDQVAIDRLKVDPARMQAAAEDVLKPILNLIDGGKTLAEIESRLAEAYPLMDDETWVLLLQTAGFVANLQGRVSAEADRG